MHRYTREYIWCHRHRRRRCRRRRRRRRVVAGQVHGELESVSRSIWDKVRRFRAPRFAETLRVAARTESALHFHFARSAGVHSQIVTPRWHRAHCTSRTREACSRGIMIFRFTAYVNSRSKAARCKFGPRDAASEFRNWKFLRHFASCTLYRTLQIRWN